MKNINMEQNRYEYAVDLSLTKAGENGEVNSERIDFIRFRDALKEAFGDRFKWLKNGSIYQDYVALCGIIEGLGEEEKQRMNDATIIGNLIVEKLGHLGWKNMGYSIQPKRTEGNIWFSFRKEQVTTSNNQI